MDLVSISRGKLTLVFSTAFLSISYICVFVISTWLNGRMPTVMRFGARAPGRGTGGEPALPPACGSGPDASAAWDFGLPPDSPIRAHLPEIVLRKSRNTRPISANDSPCACNVRKFCSLYSIEGAVAIPPPDFFSFPVFVVIPYFNLARSAWHALQVRYGLPVERRCVPLGILWRKAVTVDAAEFHGGGFLHVVGMGLQGVFQATARMNAAPAGGRWHCRGRAA